MKNPNWTRDELILTLSLYFDENSGSFDESNPKVIALSEVLNRLPIHSFDKREANFRNVRGVAMKLGNFVAIDPSNKAKGLENYGNLDEKVFFEFDKDRNRLEEVSIRIMDLLSNQEIATQLYLVENDDIMEEALEGTVLFKYHKVRERDRRLSKRKKDIVLTKTGKLECEVCEFDFYRTYGELGYGFIECHHTEPLHKLQSPKKTAISDLALVCANCHRMLHRKISIMTVELLREIVNNQKLSNNKHLP